MANYGQPECVSGAPHLMSDEVVAQGVQTAGDVGQAHGYLYEQADPFLVAAVLNHFLVHLECRTETHQSTILSTCMKIV